MKLRFVLIISLFISFCCYAAGQNQKITVKGKVALADAFHTSGDLTVTIDGTKLRGTATYPVGPKADYNYVSMVDTFESDINKDGTIDGTAVRNIRQALAEFGVGGKENIIAYVNFKQTGRIQGRYKDGKLEVEGRIFKLDRNPQSEVVDSAKAKLVLDPFLKSFQTRADEFMLFNWVFPPKTK